MGAPKAVVSPVFLDSEGKATEVIHTEPAFVADCNECPLNSSCTTKSLSQRPVITSGFPRDKGEWVEYLSESYCHPALRDREW